MVEEHNAKSFLARTEALKFVRGLPGVAHIPLHRSQSKKSTHPLKSGELPTGLKWHYCSHKITFPKMLWFELDRLLENVTDKCSAEKQWYQVSWNHKWNSTYALLSNSVLVILNTLSTQNLRKTKLNKYSISISKDQVKQFHINNKKKSKKHN